MKHTSGLLDGVMDAHKLLNNPEHICDKRYNLRTPGYWTVISAALYKKQASISVLNLTEKQRSYANTIGLIEQIFDSNCNRNNVNNGKNYSMLACLDNEESVEISNQEINGCLKNTISNFDGLGELIHVIGELHDNVWAHGKFSGFSQCQSWPHKNTIEFAIADTGIGFLKELKRVNIADIETHSDAINWCIKKGNTSKGERQRQSDGWEQQLPPDIIGGNPMGKGVGASYQTGNYHQGLGLHKLISLIKSYSGSLNIISGDAIFSLEDGIQRTTTLENCFWQGVAISFRIPLNNVSTSVATEENKDLDEVLKDLFI